MAFRPRFLVPALVVAIAACGPKADPTTGASSKPTTKKASTAPGVTLTNGVAVSGVVYGRRDTKPGTYSLLLRADLPVAQAPIFTVDGTDVRPQGKTSAAGKYDIAQLPVDKLVRVRARIKTPEGVDASLETLAKAGQTLSSDIDVASTMLTLTLVAHAKGGTIAYDAINFAKAVGALQLELDAGAPPDPAKPDDLVARTEELAKILKDVNTVVGGPLTGGSTPASTSPGPTAGPSPSPSPSPTATAPGSSPTPTPSPTATAPGASPTPSPAASPTPGPAEAYQAALTGSGMVPGVTTTASGTATGTLAADRRSFQVTGTVTGLPGGDTITAVELRYSADNTLAHAMLVNGASFSGTWAVGDGTLPLTQAAVTALEQGKVYLIVKTSAKPNGELRGTMTKQ